jgi:hypothetical protein
MPAPATITFFGVDVFLFDDACCAFNTSGNTETAALAIAVCLINVLRFNSAMKKIVAMKIER